MFKRFYRPKHFAHSVHKFATAVDRGIVIASRALNTAAPAIIAGTAAVAPQALPGVTGVLGRASAAANTYDRIRAAIKK
jgi:hypothetical protein